MDIDRWLADYKKAWEDRDADAAAALFSEDALYRENPYEEPFRGRQGVHDYWTRVTATQSDVDVRYGTVIANTDRAAVEWWVTLKNDGADVTLAGEFYLLFDSAGLVRDLREYWHFGAGAIEPAPGWGE
ncbi:nuclear transport factor 2 family protein [Microbacterium terregens]|jgi:ketosteroid isomerase-like protein|uniref:Nuclear transport factor 2 family protein n=1 Tax=Microbacterium terregens TaxID=69363 RepID=A0ABV5SYS6_9MICO